VVVHAGVSGTVMSEAVTTYAAVLFTSLDGFGTGTIGSGISKGRRPHTEHSGTSVPAATSRQAGSPLLMAQPASLPALPAIKKSHHR